MVLKMWALILVDKIRTWLLESLAKTVTVESWDDEEPNMNFIDPDYYCDKEASIFTVVDQKVLASMVVFTCCMTRKNLTDLNLHTPLVEVVAGADIDNIMFDGKITLNDLLEMASKAEVDHVVDFLLSDNVSLDRLD